MFTGIVETTGTVRGVEDRDTTRRFTIEAPDIAAELKPGESVAVDGACLTVVTPDARGFTVDVIGTTLERTIAGGYADGTRVNLERAMKMDGRLDGHLVQGHVDGLAYLEQIMKDGEFWRMDLRLPPEVSATTVVHGSITVNGVSLTVSDFLDDDRIQIGLIPFTWDHTNLGDQEPGAALNVEADLIGKYVGKILSSRIRTTPA